MKALSIVTILVLLATTTWFGVKNVETRRELETMRDTLGSLRIQQETLFDRHDSGIFEKIGEHPLQTNDSIIEAHRISASYNWTNVLLRLEVRADSSVRAVFKRFTYKHPLTSEGKDSLYAVSNPKLDMAVFQEFKAKLTQLEFPEAALDSDVLCCFGGGSLSWEAVTPPSTRYRFSTYCRQSKKFAEACEFLLQQVDDEYLKQKFD